MERELSKIKRICLKNNISFTKFFEFFKSFNETKEDAIKNMVDAVKKNRIAEAVSYAKKEGK